jgi:hypothetical protein
LVLERWCRLCNRSRYIFFLYVKSQDILEVFDGISNFVKRRAVIVSIHSAPCIFRRCGFVQREVCSSGGLLSGRALAAASKKKVKSPNGTAEAF